jgi:hypothetical protein
MSYLVFARKAGQSWKGGWHDYVGQFARLRAIRTLEYEEWMFLDLKYDVPAETHYLTFRWGGDGTTRWLLRRIF